MLTLGGVSVHPNVFHGVLETLPISGWQVIDEGTGLRVVLAGAHGLDSTAVTVALTQALERVGARRIPVRVDLVDMIPRTALGEAPLVRRAAGVHEGH